MQHLGIWLDYSGGIIKLFNVDYSVDRSAGITSNSSSYSRDFFLFLPFHVLLSRMRSEGFPLSGRLGAG